MALTGTRYPVGLQAIMNHAWRMRAFLVEREGRAHPHDPGTPWLTGRAGEVQCVVALIALDYHHRRLTGEAAAGALARYVREIHDGLAMHLDIGMPTCCRAPLARASRRAPRAADEKRRPEVQSALPSR